MTEVPRATHSAGPWGFAMSASTPDLNHIYTHEAGRYQELVAREDHEGNLLRAIAQIMPLEGVDVLETGTGTGRVAFLLAPFVRSIRAFDVNAPMLHVARTRMKSMGFDHIEFAVGQHRGLPAEEASADLIISGWSMCYVYVEGAEAWRDELSRILAEFQGFLRPGGKIILIETLGTGCTEPVRIPALAEYLDHLDDIGFHCTPIRTDYRFDSEEQARELPSFFFGEQITSELEGCVLPECTGLWWKSKDE